MYVDSFLSLISSFYIGMDLTGIFLSLFDPMTLCLARNVLGLYKACPAAVEKERSTSQSLFYGGQDSHGSAKQESAREDSVCLCWRPRRA